MPITITISESPLELLAGIPSKITLSTNVPSTIFFTLDGTDPTIESDIVVGPIEMPTNSGSVTVKAFATDGSETSPIITQTYSTNVVSARNPHDKVTFQHTGVNKATYPFGSSAQGVVDNPPIYGNTGGSIYDDGQAPRESSGFDGEGNEADFFTPPESQYQFLFSETNAIGESGRGIGTLPAKVIYSVPRNDNDHPTSSDPSKPLFDPRALVIFQDSRDEPYDPDIPRINRPFFDLEDPAKARDGRGLSVTDAISPQGGFVKAHFNPRDNTLNYYYYDNRVGRWIISKEPFTQSQNPTANLSNLVSRSSRGEGIGKVFKWIPFKYRRLV